MVQNTQLLVERAFKQLLLSGSLNASRRYRSYHFSIYTSCNLGICNFFLTVMRHFYIFQDKLVPPDSFQPRTVTSQDKEAGLCTVSQHPTQAVRMISFPSQSPSQPQGLMQNSRMNVGS